MLVDSSLDVCSCVLFILNDLIYAFSEYFSHYLLELGKIDALLPVEGYFLETLNEAIPDFATLFNAFYVSTERALGLFNRNEPIAIVVQHIKCNPQRFLVLEDVLRPGGLAELRVLHQLIIIIVKGFEKRLSLLYSHSRILGLLAHPFK